MSEPMLLHRIVKGVVTAFGVLVLPLLYFNFVTIPDGYSGMSNSLVKGVGMFVPVVVLLLATLGLVVLWWRATCARWLFLSTAVLQVLSIVGVSVFIWQGLPFPISEFLTGRGVFLGLPVVILLGMVILLHRVDKRVT